MIILFSFKEKTHVEKAQSLESMLVKSHPNFLCKIILPTCGLFNLLCFFQTTVQHISVSVGWGAMSTSRHRLPRTIRVFNKYIYSRETGAHQATQVRGGPTVLYVLFQPWWRSTAGSLKWTVSTFSLVIGVAAVDQFWFFQTKNSIVLSFFLFCSLFFYGDLFKILFKLICKICVTRFFCS